MESQLMTYERLIAELSSYQSYWNFHGYADFIQIMFNTLHKRISYRK